MLDLQQSLTKNHATSSDPIGATRMNDSSGGSQFRRAARNYQNYGDPSGGGLQFRVQTKMEDEDESGVTSPPLWKTSPPPTTSTETSPLNPHHHHHNHHLSPALRLQAIAKGRQEMMEMVQSMPESSYELSLKDLVEQPKIQATQQEALVEDRNPISYDAKGKDKKKKKHGKARLKRTGSMDNEGFLLRMFFPTLGQKKKKKKNSTTGTCAKVSPRPPLEGSEKGVDKEWWKKRFSIAGDGEKNRTDSINGITGSSSSSSSTRSRHMSGCLPGCWSFLFSKKKKSRVSERLPRLNTL